MLCIRNGIASIRSGSDWIKGHSRNMVSTIGFLNVVFELEKCRVNDTGFWRRDKRMKMH